MKSKKLELPAPPTYQKPQLAIDNNKLLSDYGKSLSSGDFTGNLEWLKPLISNDNGQNALAYAQATLQPQFRDTIQQITNSAAANGSLNSSTFTDALAKASSDVNSNYQAILAQQAINDSNQSNQNRLNLFGTGLNTLQGTINNDRGLSGDENTFNLQNYDNLVAQAIQNNKNANSANVWQQAIGMFSPIGHDYLKSQGINSVPGYGVADIANIAGSFMGFGRGIGNSGGGQQQLSNIFRTGGSAPGAGSYAMNANPYMNSSPYSPNYNYNPFFN